MTVSGRIREIGALKDSRGKNTDDNGDGTLECTVSRCIEADGLTPLMAAHLYVK